MMPVDCIFEQIKKYSEGKTDESDTLFILYAGANDAYFALDEGGTPSEVVDDLKTAVKNLQKIGASLSLVLVLRRSSRSDSRSVGRRPVHHHPDAASNRRELPLRCASPLSRLVDDVLHELTLGPSPLQNALPEAAPLMYFFSTELRKQYMEWAKKETKVAIADFYSLFSRIMGKPEDYGFKREYLKVGCIAHNCKDDWREFIWFDDVRPRSLSPCAPLGRSS